MTWLIKIAVAQSTFSNGSTTGPITTPQTTSKPTKTMRSCLYPIQSDVDDGSVEAGSDFNCNRPGDPQVLEGNNNRYVYASWTDIASTCSVIFESSLSAWMVCNFFVLCCLRQRSHLISNKPRIPLIGSKATADYQSRYITFTRETETTPYTTQTNVVYNDFFSYSAQEPCCLNCTLTGGDVQVYWWPTSTAGASLPSKLINSANFTLFVPLIAPFSPTSKVTRH